MVESDYHMALILQNNYEQEATISCNIELTDEALARQLQEQFEREEAENRPPPSLVYKSSKQKGHSSKCLVDPSWELVDPTPDIHNLFMVFNERFFWNKLLAVCVSWSKRMTSCAGICSYHPRGGLCSITLSEPLLKLRPRKDLVETLLHEMIHAFLFVTCNDRDRDGHGPEFHKHMHRINTEAGTNITVYHDFHDEVRLYKQHWWRCNGPCQQWKPYFGMVRRATNRAPGPYDRWWGQHDRSCGGTFIKVKEPEKVSVTQKKPQDKLVKKSTSNVNSKDIRDFFINDNRPSEVAISRNSVPDKCQTSNILIDSNRNTAGNCSNDFLSVRNHWANKFETSNKRPLIETASNAPKIQRSDNSEDYCNCPVCNEKMLLLNLDSHLDNCLQKVDSAHCVLPNENKECPICYKKVDQDIFDSHVAKCVMKVYDEIDDRLENRKIEEVADC